MPATNEPSAQEARQATDLRAMAAVRIIYTNYRNETAVRTIVPERIWFGTTAWHPIEQWLLQAYDLDRAETRSFALADIKSWSRQMTE